MSDSLCKYYDVKLTPNHFPMRKDFSGITVLSHSSMPVCNKQDSRLPPATNASIQKVGTTKTHCSVFIS